MGQEKRQKEAVKSWDGAGEVGREVEVDNRKGWEVNGEAMQRVGKTLPEKVADALTNRR